mmetsp:Transcript_25592/g.22620  ORF Transcript_25592/g.22620 Transcript_25592/m.22620 type:complete len:122 (+) Transcript_25592:41-406(+)
MFKFTDDYLLPPFEMTFALISLATSISWIYTTANFIIQFLELIGVVTEFHPTYIGLSLLAWGNSAGDLFANRSLAKMGYGVMALTGCFAGPLFNLLIGFGCLAVRETIENGTIPFKIFAFD